MKVPIKIQADDEIFCERMKEFLISQYGNLFTFGKEEESTTIRFSTKREEEGIYCFQSGHRLVQEILWDRKEKEVFDSDKEAAITFILEDSAQKVQQRKSLVKGICRQHPEEKILYLSFCKRNLFSEQTWKDYQRDVTDLIYTAYYHPDYFWSRMKGCTFVEDGLTSIIPPVNLWNCILLSQEAYEVFFQKLQKRSPYDRIIVEVDSLLPCNNILAQQMEEGYCLYGETQDKRQCQLELSKSLVLWGLEEKLDCWKFVRGGERGDESESGPSV